jgi:uncharacterized repeat protein (TIGR01451 family)
MKATKIGAFLLVPVLLVSLLLTAGVVLAVHDLDLFELDRNATDEVGNGDDWATLYAGGGSAAEFTGVIEDTMGTNPFGTVGTQFQAGGSKDDLDISPGGATGQYWKWEPGEPLDKDDITNAYAAAYVNTVDTGENNIGDLIVYFGLDRYANNGSAQVGFWFLQDPNFGLTTTKDGGGYRFSGYHEVGDVLVQSNFSQGGVIDTISVYEWVGSGGSDGTLNLLFNAQDCLTPGLGDDPACATVNQGDTPSPWPFTPKFGTSGTFPQGSFFEGGINITRLVPDAGCFTGFLAETRSSTPFDSRLKDFAFGNFELCSIAVTKGGDTLSKVGDDVNYTITVENTGALTLYKQSVVDSLLGDLTDGTNPLITSSDCGASLAAGDSCTINATRTVQLGDTDPLPNTVNVVYNSSSDLLGDEASGSDDHSVNLFQPSIAFDKSVSADLSKVGDSVDYTLKLDNTSSADTPDLECTITDAALGINKSVTLASGESDTTMQSYTFQEGDSDPYNNTASVVCSPVGFPNVLPASDSESVNLFQPSITFDKSGDDLSKVGDDVDYTLTLNNTSSGDTPDLVCTITDAMLGINKSVTLASGASDVTNATYTVQEGDSDPLENTASVSCSPDGFPNVLNDSDDHSVNLFQPSISFDKSVSSNLSKVGDSVDYTLKLDNTSSADAPDLECTITDAVLGINKSVTLASGESDTTMQSYTFQEGDSDPYNNTASVVCSPIGFPNVLPASDSESVNLFQPSITFDKTGSHEYSKAGDDVDYTLTLNNTSSGDTPDLVCTITDAMLGINKSVTLASGGSDVTNATYTVQEGDDDPLTNTASVSCSPDGFPNVLNDSDSYTVDLIHPSFTVDKTCVAEPISYLGPANFQVTIANTGDVPLDITADDGIGAFQLAAGASQDFDVSVPGPFTPGGTADNTVTASWTLPEEYGLDNTDTKSASDSCDVVQPVYETAYALGDAATCFIDLGANNWGWVNGDGAAYILPGDYTWPVWAGAGQCDTDNGTLVGTATVSYDGTDVSVSFDIDPQYVLGDTHIYAGYDQIPPGGFSPGQWQIYSPFDGSAIYVIVHAVVGIPQ